MKNSLLFLLFLGAVVGLGCAAQKHQMVSNPPAKGVPSAIVTPEVSVAAKVLSVNAVGHFVVIGFPDGNLPKLQQTLSLYRAGLKVGEVKITGPQSVNNIVADIISGEAKMGDTVRDQ